jgi:ABC-2 type transport system ATP-binding protein
MDVIKATALHKAYGDVQALAGFDLEVGKGRIVGLIGPNGSGKTTALKAILGLGTVDSGELNVLDKDPMRERASLMRNVAYIADTGILPRWMKVRELLDYVEAVHPNFTRETAESRLAETEIRLDKRVSVLSKGMHVQLHLAIILAIGAELLVLDEPTLGLDILYRQRFYDAVLNDYFDGERSILVTTHEVREIEHILTDVVFVHQGRTALALAMDEVAEQFVKVVSMPDVDIPHTPIVRKPTLAGIESIFRGTSSAALEDFGEVSTPNLAELFVAVVEGQHA